MTTQGIDIMAVWQDGRMAEWQDHRMGEWQDSRVAGWKVADRVARWQDGK